MAYLSILQKKLLLELYDVEYEYLLRLQILNDELQAQEKKKKVKRLCWVKPWIRRRGEQGHYQNLIQELRLTDSASYRNYARFPPNLIDELVGRLRVHLQKTDTNWREALSPELKLLATLRYLATGDSYKSLQYAFRVGHSTISKFIPEVCKAIVEELMPECIACPRTPEEWKAVAAGFQNRWNLPHCLGAVDGKHVAITCPPGSGSEYHNYKGFFSMIMLAVVDHDYKYLWLDVGANGACSDAQIFNSSDFVNLLVDGELGIPEAEPLTGQKRNLPYFLVGDDAFGLKPWLMKPYCRRGMTHKERIFNYRLSRARRVVENAFGITAQRFRCLFTTMKQKPDTVKYIVLACCVLHNYLRIKLPKDTPDPTDDPDKSNRSFDSLPDVPQDPGPRNASREAKEQRHYLADHFCHAGAVSWQEKMI